MSPSIPDERTPLLSNDIDNVERQQPSSRAATPSCGKADPKLPMKPLVVLTILNAMQPLVFELVFPFINQMLVETGVVEDAERVGFYSGFIESCYALMSFVAILPCGFLSDRFGRKPIILLGILGLAISTSFFGVSRTYLSMIISRCLGGTMGGSGSAMKIMVGELTDKSTQGTAFSWLTMSYRTGQVLGLPLGGYLSHPERHLELFRTPFWCQYPFALPCFVASFIALLAVVMGYFYLDETRPVKPKRPSHIRQQSDNDCTFPGSTQEERPQAVLGMVNVKKAPLKSVLSPPIISLLSSSTAMCLVSEMLFALYPLFAFTSIEAGGLGIDEATIGAHLALRSLLPIPFMLFFPVIQKRLGTVRMYQLVLSTIPIVVVFFPTLNQLARADVGVWMMNSALLGYFIAWSWCGLAWTCSAIMVNDIAPSADSLATINAISQMAIVLPQAVAPVMGTSMFAASIGSPLLSGNMIWAVLFVFSMIVALHSYTLREPDSDWREEKDKEELESSAFEST